MMQNTDGDDHHSSANTDDTLSGQPRRRLKKLYHKKSRTGCATCRSRRVKVGSVRLFLIFILINCSATKCILYVETVKDTG